MSSRWKPDEVVALGLSYQQTNKEKPLPTLKAIAEDIFSRTWLAFRPPNCSVNRTQKAIKEKLVSVVQSGQVEIVPDVSLLSSPCIKFSHCLILFL
jgi:hypothetical protein